MAKCKVCGAPVNLAPDGDPKYELPWRYRHLEQENERLRELYVAVKDLVGWRYLSHIKPIDPDWSCDLDRVMRALKAADKAVRDETR